MIILLLIGFLMLGGVALILLDSAIEYAEDGYEDESGFHQETRHTNLETDTPDSGIRIWDQIEGACCPLDMGPRFRSMSTNSFPRPRH